MTLTKLTYTKEENRQASHQAEANPSHEASQILHLQRLLVTMKQLYEKNLHQIQTQLHAEQNQRLAIQKDLEKAQAQLGENQKCHDEEIQALRHQQETLKELLKKAQEGLNQQQEESPSKEPGEEGDRQRVEHLERVIPYLRDRREEANLEVEQLRELLNEAQKKATLLENELAENRVNTQKEIEHFKQLLEENKQQGNELETVVSTTSSHYLRRELENIKRTLIQGNQETKAIEARYIEILNEKIGLEHQCKQLQLQLEHQSSNLTSFQAQIHELEDNKKVLDVTLQTKEEEWKENFRQQQELKARLEGLNELVREKELIQEKYEQLKEEWKQISERLDEAIEIRTQSDQHLNQLEEIAANQETQLQELAQQLQMIKQEKGEMENDRSQLKTLLDESEMRLKVAQQHLAKKVKEGALLGEKLDEQHSNLTEFAQTIEQQKNQIAQLQASVDLYQRQEKRLQEQLHEALKGTESQIIKWEEKYFRMYDKWQESENRIRELKKFEEKHLQMQSLLANLGNFMGGAFNPTNPMFHPGQEIAERPIARPFSFDTPLTENPSQEPSKPPSQEEKYDLFGLQQPPEKYHPHLFS